MTDEIEKKDDENTEGDEDKNKDKEKLFSQAELNKIIQREKAKSKLQLEQTIDSYKDKDIVLEKYENTILAIVTELSKDLAEPVKKLLSKATPLEQLEYLNDPANNVLFEKKQFPLSKKKGEKQGDFVPAPIEKFL